MHYNMIFLQKSRENTGAQCSKWYEISDMDIFQITEETPDPPTNQGA